MMIKKLILISLVLVSLMASAQTQVIERLQPTHWFGISGAANFNFFSGTTQTLNSTFAVPSAFHEGNGIKPYGSILYEYRPNPVFGLMLNAGYDGRGGAFDQVIAPCNCPADLETGLSSFVFEPSLRIAPFGSSFYVFVGGVYSYNYNKEFKYTQETTATDATLKIEEGNFGEIRSSKISAQVGAGFDIPLSSVTNRTQVNLSPFISYHPYFGQAPRSIESWSLQSVRVGIALKFGMANAKPVAVAPVVIPPAVVVENNVAFTIKAPATVPAKRIIKETFPLRNYVFFDAGSSEIPSRYVTLSKDQAVSFKANLLQDAEPKDVDGRSKRQLAVYYNILNILGDRMKENPTTNVTLIGSSAGKGEAAGKVYAESIKSYLVDVFGISGSRIKTEGRNQPIIPSAQPGGTVDLLLLQEGDRRVDIVSNSAILLAPLQFTTVQDDLVEGKVVFMMAPEQEESIKDWSIALTDEKGIVQNFGPFTSEQASINGNVILGDKAEGNYKVVMIANTKDGKTIRKESNLRLVHDAAFVQEGLRFSILFDFDKSKTVTAYQNFLNDVVAPQITDNATVIIHGHSDIIGNELHNMTLSQERARDAQTILEHSLAKAGKKGVKFETYGFGDKTDFAPFKNSLPEERFYNRTVIIDVILVK